MSVIGLMRALMSAASESPSAPPAALTVSGPTTATTTSTAPSVQVTLPPGEGAPGELLLLACYTGGSAGLTTPTGWALSESYYNSTTGKTFTIFYRWADGSEGGSVTVSAGNSVLWTVVCYRIAGAYAGAAPEFVRGLRHNVTSYDMPSVTPSWGAAKAVALALSSIHYDDALVVEYPLPNGGRLAGGYRHHMAYSHEVLAETSLVDPGILTTSRNDYGTAYTIAVRGS